MIAADVLAKALTDFLPRQRWFAGDPRAPLQVKVVRAEVLRPPWPALVWVLAEVVGEQGGPVTYQVVCGLRQVDDEVEFYEGKPDALVGEIESEAGPAFAYDALIDETLAIALLGHIAPEEEVRRARPMSLEQSNSSIVYDERLILKLFRRLVDGPNPDAEVSRALAGAGFEHVAAPVAEWRTDRYDLAIVSEFLLGGIDGFQLALTSLRDLYDLRCDPAEAGGDFAPESRRLGGVTAEMHLALARAFGAEDADLDGWLDDMDAHARRVDHPDLPVASIAARYQGARSITDPGRSLRVHGDYHLSQAMRTDTGWSVLDFEGEPARPLEERRRRSSPLRDVAGLLRSLHYATRIALLERGPEADAELDALARAWDERNRTAFLEGYLAVEGIGDVLPSDPGDRDRLRRVFELDKVVYEVGYELEHRPDWVEIPLSAVHEILEGQA